MAYQPGHIPRHTLQPRLENGEVGGTTGWRICKERRFLVRGQRFGCASRSTVGPRNITQGPLHLHFHRDPTLLR